MIRFIEAHKGHHGVERICRVLAGTPGGFLSVAGYYAARRRAPSARALRDAELVEVVRRVHAVNYSVYGVRKMQAALAREGVVVGRDQTRRLMRLAGVRGVHRGMFKRTTVTDPAATRPADLVNRNFHPGRPDALWVADITYIRTWSGWAYLALVIDAHSRRVLGWALAAHLRTELPLEALNMAFWTRGRTGADLAGLVAHTDAGTQYTSLRYTERLVEGGALASIGSVGDSYDNAMAESTIGQIKTELIALHGPWRTLAALELALFEYLDWWNHRRLHGELGMLTPVEVEHAHAQPAPLAEVGTQ